jgi:dihydrofolate synthase/folylpolyglutamate synthase
MSDLSSALAYLDAHASYDTTGRVESPSLDVITAFCAAMGDPQHAAPSIHVTGTNGKGSTAQMITRLLVADGLTVGTYTSPHLERVNERISRNSEPISDHDLAEQIAAIADLEMLIGRRPSYFEIMTAAAFRWFADVAVDVMVVEVGLLGRWDATNVVDAHVAVVTNIGMDHMEFAGPTLAHIANEKSGIIKPGSAAIIGETDPELVSIFAAAGGASTLVRGVDFDTTSNALAVGGRLVDLRTPTTIYPDVYLPLHGAHQGDNAILALTAVETFFAAPLALDVVL